MLLLIKLSQAHDGPISTFTTLFMALTWLLPRVTA